MKSKIRVENLCKSTEDGQTLTMINFTVHEGEVFGILGHTGVGKTTLLNLLGGLSRPDSGVIWADEVSMADDWQGCKAKIGYLPARIGFYEHMTARENLRFFAGLYNLRAGEAEGRIQLLLEEVGLETLADTRVCGWNPSELHQLGLARTLIHDPQIIILDEPERNLGLTARKRFRRFLSQLSRQGKTILFSSEHPEPIVCLCTSAAVLVQGKLFVLGKVDTFRRRLSEEVHKAEIHIIAPVTGETASGENSQTAIGMSMEDGSSNAPGAGHNRRNVMDISLEKVLCNPVETGQTGQNGQGEIGTSMEKTSCSPAETGQNGQSEMGTSMDKASCTRAETGQNGQSEMGTSMDKASCTRAETGQNGQSEMGTSMDKASCSPTETGQNGQSEMGTSMDKASCSPAKESIRRTAKAIQTCVTQHGMEIIDAWDQTIRVIGGLSVSELSVLLSGAGFAINVGMLEPTEEEQLRYLCTQLHRDEWGENLDANRSAII